MSEARLTPEGEAWEIVRELAEQDAPENCCGGCILCGAEHVPGTWQALDLSDPSNHDPSCLWRRARELHPPA